MKLACTILLVLLCHAAKAQLQDADPDETEERNLEGLAENTDTESEDEYYMQQMRLYKKHPLNINGTEQDLNEFPLLEPLQIENIIKYRNLLGDFISMYELQAVPGFTASLVRRMLPYITIADGLKVKRIAERFHEGERILVFRPSLVPEKSKGFSRNTPSAQRYQGGRIKLLARYKYQYRDLLQYGFVADQDAGEKFSFRQKQYGFDFYSFHLFARKIGIIRALALGDYTVNLGQGLIQWQSQAFNKSSQVINIKRQSEVLRPYNSAGEYNFFRGTGVTISKGHVESTVFVSLRKLSANIADDGTYGRIFTSLQTSGLHRTVSEIEDRNSVSMKVAGGNLKWQHSTGHVALNVVACRYSLPIIRRDQPYNLFSMKGDNWLNYSLDYSFTAHNYHFFGELASDKKNYHAVVSGLVASLNPVVDIAVLYRSISRAYQSVYGNAFTENSVPSNENGLYVGMSVRPSMQMKLDFYADVFRFPWLRYGADAPGFGWQYLAQADWVPNKRAEVYTRVRFKMKPANEPGSSQAFHVPVDKLLRNWRTHVNFHLNRNITLRNRIEFCWSGKPADDSSGTGFLFYTDVLYKPFGKGWSGGARFQVFETNGYDTRLYAYENDVLFASSTPAFFDKGARIYSYFRVRLQLRQLKGYEVNLGVKASSSLSANKLSIGSGQDEIPGRHKSEIKFQLLISTG